MSNDVLAHVARLYFVRDLTKQEIARRLGISRFKVARLLEEARAQGVVRFEIREPVPVADSLAAELEARYGLDLALVVDTGSIPRAAAGLLSDLLDGEDVLGVAWGATVAATVEELPVLTTGTPVVQVCGAVPGLEAGTGPTEVALELAAKTGGPVHALPAPAFAGYAARDELLANDVVRPTVELFDRVTLVLVGIGARGDGGHVLVHVFDGDGAIVDSDLADRAIALPLERLRAARVVAVAGGHDKAAAVRGALRARLVDVLVTDEECARAALE